MSGFYKSEVQVYNTLKVIQDIDIPKHFACVAAPTSQETQVWQYVNIPGVLWQQHEGFRLVDVAVHSPRESWQFICEDAIRISISSLNEEY
jgi:hypothetical protein